MTGGLTQQASKLGQITGDIMDIFCASCTVWRNRAQTHLDMLRGGLDGSEEGLLGLLRALQGTEYAAYADQPSQLQAL